MKKIGIFILDLKEYAVLVVLIIISLFLIFSNDNPQIRFIRAVAVSAFGTVQSGFSMIPNVFELQQENKLLRESNIRLSNELSDLKEAKLENIRLTKILKFKERIQLDFVSGKIVNKSLIQTRNNITISAGENDGVKAGMPVITDDGLVGRVVLASSNYCIAQILLNKELRITVKDQRSRVDGILSYDGIQNLYMKNVPKNADVNQGDLIITSDYSNIFPSGIPVGYVAETGNLDNLFKKVIINPAVNFITLEEVFIIKHVPSAEKTGLENLFLKK